LTFGIKKDNVEKIVYKLKPKKMTAEKIIYLILGVCELKTEDREILNQIHKDSSCYSRAIDLSEGEILDFIESLKPFELTKEMEEFSKEFTIQKKVQYKDKQKRKKLYLKNKWISHLLLGDDKPSLEDNQDD
jgi:hypothetical protein